MYNKNMKKTFEILRSEITFFNGPVYVLKKLTFDQLTLSLWSGWVCRQSICDHVAALVIFNLICNLTML